MGSWYAFVRFSEDPTDREGHVFASHDEALAWRERAKARDGVVAAGLLPESARQRARQFAAEQRARS